MMIRSIQVSFAIFLTASLLLAALLIDINSRAILPAYAQSAGDNLWNIRINADDRFHSNEGYVRPWRYNYDDGWGRWVGYWSYHIQWYGGPYTQPTGSHGALSWSTSPDGRLSVSAYSRDYQWHAWTYAYVDVETIVNIPLTGDCIPTLFLNYAFDIPMIWGGYVTLVPGWNRIDITGYNQNDVYVFNSNCELAANVDIMDSQSNQPPDADAGGPYTVTEASPVPFDASGSSDPDGDPLEYRWDFSNDGTWDTGWSVSPYASYNWCEDYTGTVKVEVSDDQETATATSSVTVLNVAPDIYSTSFVYTLSQGTNSWTIPAVESIETPTQFYDYYSYSAHTGYEKPYQSFVYLYRDIDDPSGDVSLFIVHDIDGDVYYDDIGYDSGAPDAKCNMDLSGLPSSAYLAQSDDPGEFQYTNGASTAQGVWHWTYRTDGGALGGLPTDSSWCINITPTFWSDVNSWAYYYAGGDNIDLDMSTPITICYEAQDEPTTVTTDEGTPITLGASATDVGCDDTILDWEFTWNDPNDPGATSSGTTLWDQLFTAEHTYCDDGVYYPDLVVTDSDGATDTQTFTVIVNNVAPVADAGPDQTVNEGDTVTFSGSAIDPGCDDLTFEWDFGDGNTAAGEVAEHIYCDNGAYMVTLTVTDDDGGVGTDTMTVTVLNIAPEVGLINAPIDPVMVGVVIEAEACFTDSGTCDTHTAELSWGDGSSTQGVVVETDGSGCVSGSYPYTEPGIYTVILTVTDDDGSVGTTEYQYVVVYDPEGGFVTGGGWIDSPPEAYTPDPSLTGKATFGFVSKYKKGATTPTGQTEFQFKVAGLNFHSDSYDWLVIAGSRAKYKGTGTINGIGSYGFMLSAIDAALTPSTDTDLFRIKILDKQTGQIVYDNKLGEADDSYDCQAIGGGSIVIHKK